MPPLVARLAGIRIATARAAPAEQAQVTAIDARDQLPSDFAGWGL